MSFGDDDFGESPFGSTNEDEENDRILTSHSNPPDDGSPKDLLVTSRQDIAWADGGDLATVNGHENALQSAALSSLHVIDPEIGGAMEPNDIHRIESQIYDILTDDPQVETVIDVSVDSYNEDDNQLNFSVNLDTDDDYTIPLKSMSDRYTSHEDGETITYLASDEKVYDPTEDDYGGAVGGASDGYIPGSDGSEGDEEYDSAGYGTAYGQYYK